MTADDTTFGAVPASFATQMAMAMTPMALGKTSGTDKDNARMGKLMLAKMKTLEESMSDMVREMRVLRSAVPSTAYNSGDELGLRKNGSGLSGGQAVVEIAKGEGPRRRVTARPRMVGRRITMEGDGYLASPLGKDKGKGKAVALSDTDEDLGFDGSQGMDKRGSSL